jgi:hypothetical protein
VWRYYAADIRAGRRRPHPRHWQTQTKQIGVSADHRRNESLQQQYPLPEGI